jgi:hypothetical protein
MLQNCHKLISAPQHTSLPATETPFTTISVVDVTLSVGSVSICYLEYSTAAQQNARGLGFRIACCRGINNDELSDGRWLAPSNIFRIASSDHDDWIGRGCGDNRHSRRGALLNESGNRHNGVSVPDNGPHVDGVEHVAVGVAAADKHGVFVAVKEE